MSTPTLNLKAICDNLALRFVAATIGTPSGASAMRGSYAQQPKGIAATPFHYLEVQDGTVTANPGQWKHEISIDGVFVLSKRPGDPARVDTQRQRWLPYLLHATVDQLKIGLGGAAGYTVDKVIPTTWEFETVVIGDEEFDAIRVHWTVFVTENVSLTP